VVCCHSPLSLRNGSGDGVGNNVTRSVTSPTMSSPIIFKRTKSKPNHRSRQTSPDAAGAVESERKEGESPSALAAKLKKRAKTKTTLSFGDEVRPSESSILISKQKRDRLRTVSTAGKEEDYISLTVTKEDDEYRGPHPESRLMREEDELGEGEDGKAESLYMRSSNP
jgi:hypothetical protein